MTCTIKKKKLNDHNRYKFARGDWAQTFEDISKNLRIFEEAKKNSGVFKSFPVLFSLNSLAGNGHDHGTIIRNTSQYEEVKKNMIQYLYTRIAHNWETEFVCAQHRAKWGYTTGSPDNSSIH